MRKVVSSEGFVTTVLFVILTCANACIFIVFVI